MSTIRVTSGPGEGQSVEIDRELVIGRVGADLTIDDPEVSRRHAAVRPVERGVVVEDLGSTNGTVVDGKRISEPVTLVANATVQVGTSMLELQVVRDTATVMRPQPDQAQPPQPAPPEPAPPGPPVEAPAPAPEPQPVAAAAPPPVAAPPPSGPPAGGGPPGGGPPGGGPPGGPPAVAGRPPGRRELPRPVPILLAGAAAAAIATVVLALTVGSPSKSTSNAAPMKPGPPVGVGTLLPFHGTFPIIPSDSIKVALKGTVSVSVTQQTLPAHGGESWHTHPGPGLIIIKSGLVHEFIAKGSGCTEQIEKPGQAFWRDGSTRHELLNEGTKPAIAVVVSFLTAKEAATPVIPGHKPPKCSH